MNPVQKSRKCAWCLEKFTYIVVSPEYEPVTCCEECTRRIEQKLGIHADETLSGVPKQIDPALAIVRPHYFRRVKIVRLDLGKRVDVEERGL